MFYLWKEIACMNYNPISFQAGTHFGSNRWTVFSPKINRRINLYSNLEYYHWLKIEKNPNIIDFCEQPMKIKYFDQISNRSRFTIPDMIIEDVDHNYTLIEVKYKNELNDNRVKNQLKGQREWCAKEKIEHKVFTEEILENIFYITAYKSIVQSVASNDKKVLAIRMQEILELNIPDKITTIGGIMTEFKSQTEKTIPSIFQLIYDGRITFKNLKDKMCTNTEVIING